MKEARYLEIGTWKGSSICSAMCNNKIYTDNNSNDIRLRFDFR